MDPRPPPHTHPLSWRCPVFPVSAGGGGGGGGVAGVSAAGRQTALGESN